MDALKLHPAVRIHLTPEPAPAPFPYPARFLLAEGEDFLKPGHKPFPHDRPPDPHWTPEILTQTWYQAETGRIPISGAGYGGPFGGEGFDGIWMDMSEIVRPTRDGIHGREYISTLVDLGGTPVALAFAPDGRLAGPLPPQLSLPFPVLFNPYPLPLPGRGALRAAAAAAARTGTLALIYPEDWDEDLAPYAAHLGARLTDPQVHLPWTPPLVELEVEDPAEALPLWEAARRRWPQALISLLLPLTEGSPEEVEALARAGVRLIHLQGDDEARTADGAQALPDALSAVHLRLVEQGLRDRLSLVVSGGIAAAEHVPKSLICGADAVGVDFVLQVALGCALWADHGRCVVEKEEIDPEWGARRLVNLMVAWRDQLLEVLGAMGMRDVRRLRGERGRAIFQAEEEAAFRALFPRTAPKPPDPPLAPEGDRRWTHALLLTTHEQARTGEPPTSGLEFRTGASGGGFDRLRFPFELEGEVPLADPEEVDLSLPLNRRNDGRPQVRLNLPFYGGGMSYGSVSLRVMLARAMAAKELGILISTGEGGYPDELIPYAPWIITQVATGLFGVREETIRRAPVVEFKYAQGAKPGLGGHLLGDKVGEAVARIRESVPGVSLYSPFPFHSVYSVEDHKKHLDWIAAVHPRGLLSVKVSTPTDVDMVAVGSYYAGAHIVHIDGGYGGTGAAPEVAKKNIATPIEYAIPKVHRFLTEEGVRDQVTLIASGGIRTAYDVAKAIALGADGCVLGTADLVALGCTRLGECHKRRGCPFGLTTTVPELARQVDPEEGARRIVNLYRSWAKQLAGILKALGMTSIAELRGRTDLLVYLE